MVWKHNYLLDVIPIITSSLPALQRFGIIESNPFHGHFTIQTHLAMLQDAFGAAGVEFVSRRPHLPTMPWHGQFFCLDYVEPDWVWVQPMCDRDAPSWSRCDDDGPLGRTSIKDAVENVTSRDVGAAADTGGETLEDDGMNDDSMDTSRPWMTCKTMRPA